MCKEFLPESFTINENAALNYPIQIGLDNCLHDSKLWICEDEVSEKNSKLKDNCSTSQFHMQLDNHNLVRRVEGINNNIDCLGNSESENSGSEIWY